MVNILCFLALIAAESSRLQRGHDKSERRDSKAIWPPQNDLLCAVALA